MFNFLKMNFLSEANSSKQLAYAKAFDLMVIITITILLYAPIVHNEFVIDDTAFILRWEHAHSLNNLPDLIKGNLPAGHEGIYRPLRSVFYALSYQLWGTNPTGYHILAISMNAIVTLLIYMTVLKIVQKKPVAFISALLFGIHPLHTEAVTYITASFDTIGAVFFFSSFYFYLKLCEHKRIKIGLLLISVLFAVLAFLSYEITLILPFLIVLYDVCFRIINKQNRVSKIGIYLLYFLPVLAYGYFRVFILHITHRGEYLAGSFYLTMLTMTKVFLKYIMLFLVPVHLSINPQISGGIESWINRYTNLDPILNQKITDGDIVISIVVISALIFAAIFLFRKFPVATFCIGWIFAGLLPVSYILPQGFLMAERNGYIASFGFALLFAVVFVHFYGKLQKELLQKTAILFLIATIIFFSFLTIKRNRDWENELSIWQSLTHQEVGTVKAHQIVGNLLTNKGDFKEAIEEYKQVLKDRPNDIDIAYSLIVAYAADGQYSKARVDYKRILSIQPNYSLPIRKIVDNLLDGGKAEIPKEKVKEVGWKTYTQEFSFEYPGNWRVAKIERGVLLKEAESGLQIEIIQEKKEDTTTFEDYLNNNKSSYGELKNQGVAEIPQVNLAFVRSWWDKNVTTSQYFLFKADKVYVIKIWPANTASFQKALKVIYSIHNANTSVILRSETTKDLTQILRYAQNDNCEIRG